ncbi:MAG TPA: CpaF family protein, partial [Bradyrhizobium sp.]|nr:CpaF family protein [Bradyrhizobium sp.]
MFGKRSGSDTEMRGMRPAPAAPEAAPAPAPVAPRAAPAQVASPPLAPARSMAPPPPPPPPMEARRSDNYYQVKATIFGALIEAIDLAQLAKLDSESAREEIRDIVNEIIAIKNIVMSIAEQEELLDDICN